MILQFTKKPFVLIGQICLGRSVVTFCLTGGLPLNFTWVVLMTL